MFYKCFHKCLCNTRSWHSAMHWALCVVTKILKKCNVLWTFEQPKNSRLKLSNFLTFFQPTSILKAACREQKWILWIDHIICYPPVCKPFLPKVAHIFVINLCYYEMHILRLVSLINAQSIRENLWVDLGPNCLYFIGGKSELLHLSFYQVS